MKVRDLITELLEFEMDQEVELEVDSKRVDIEDIKEWYQESDLIVIVAETDGMSLESEGDVSMWKEKAELYDELEIGEE